MEAPIVKSRSCRCLFVVLTWVALAAPLLADVRVPAILSDHLVLQRGEPAVIWGWADAGESVTVTFADRTRTTLARADGRWRVSLGSLEASADPRPLTIRGAENEIVLSDVLVGEVWLCSGQSNMVWRVQSSEGFEAAKAAADLPRIRMFTGAQRSTTEPQDDLPGDWTVCSPETVGSFSAAAFYFGRDLHETLGVPIGLVNVSWGGSTVEAWTRQAALEACPQAARVLEEQRRYAAALETNVERFAGASADLAEWEPAALPARYEDLGHPDLDGVVWFRRTIIIPEAWRGQALTVSLGNIDDEDETYFAGRRIGGIDDWRAERRYTVPAELTTAEEAVLAVRVRDGAGPGGFVGDPKQMFLAPAEPGASLALSGPWHYRIVSNLSPPGPQQRPSALSNGMIHPLEPLRFRGALWYQGENNAFRGKSHEYGGLLEAMIGDWRARFDAPKMPFLIVQLPEFAENDDRSTWDWPRLREGQLDAYRALENTGLIVTLGLGDARDIHPRRKLEVGQRAARWARSTVYGEPGLSAGGPIYRGAEFLEGGRVRVHFETFGSPLKSARERGLGGFVIAGAQGGFIPAQAQIDSATTVLVWHDDIPHPKAVRYAWANTPEEADLTTQLPASPFRTDRR